MTGVMDDPLLIFAVSFLGLSLSAWIGRRLSRRSRELDAAMHEDFGVIQAASLTFLGLIIGFSFSMALGRYDQRKQCEAVEANTMGTEYLRAGLLPADDAAKVKTLLLSYLDQRILFYNTGDERRVSGIKARTAELQAELWEAVRAPAVARPQIVAALAVAGMNEVLDSQGYTQAAWWNRLLIPAWALMAVIAVFSTMLVAFGASSDKTRFVLLLVLPLLDSIAFYLIADIDSPHGGLIQMVPHSLISLSQSLHVP